MSADHVFHSGRIFDGHDLHPTATAVAVEGDRVVAVGTDEQVRPLATSATESVDLAGRLLHPGFTDAHVHAVQAGVERLGCDLSETEGEPATLAAVAAYAGGSDQPWIVGGGWSMADYPGGTPSAATLDRIGAIGDRPTFLVNRDHHGAWVNSAALRLAGIDAHTPDPADGRIERDAEGRPTGTLHEGAMDLVGRLRPPTTNADLLAGLVEAQRVLHGFGITGWQEAIIGDYAATPDVMPAYLQAIDEGLLTGRVVGALWWPRDVEDVEQAVSSLAAVRAAHPSGPFRPTSVKIMIDGVPENRTAAMKDPYLTECTCGGDERGIAYFDTDLLHRSVVALDAAGFDVHMHAIGDRAVASGLDAVERARQANGRSNGRHHLAHVQIVDPVDIPRFAALGVSANLQALWAANDPQMVSLTKPLLGPERSSWQYPFASFAQHGTHLAMGSDWPVSTPDPWAAIHVAVCRREPGLADQEPLVAEQALTLTQALRAYTAGSAWINRNDQGGRIRPGALADLAVCGADPFTLNATELHTARTDLTMVGGRIVHAA